MKKLILVLILVAILAAVACASGKGTDTNTGTENTSPVVTPTPVKPSPPYLPTGETWTGSAEQEANVQAWMARSDYSHAYWVWRCYGYVNLTAEQEAWIQSLVGMQVIAGSPGQLYTYETALEQALIYNAWSNEDVQWVYEHRGQPKP